MSAPSIGSSRHPAHSRVTARWPRPTMPPVQRDARGYVRAPATMAGAGAGRTPANKGRTYEPDPPSPAEVIAMLQQCPDTPIGHRQRALTTFLWRTGARINEALHLIESDLDPIKGSVTIRHGKGNKRRVIGLDPWGWEQLRPWLTERRNYPPGEVFCVLEGPTAGRGMNASQYRQELHRLATRAGIRKRVAPHQFRHALAVDLLHERARLDLIQRQLGHANLQVTTRYLLGIDQQEVLDLANQRRAPSLSAPDLMEVLRVG